MDSGNHRLQCKTAGLVKETFQSVEGNFGDIRLLHTERGNEFKNQKIEELLEAFYIERSLSHKDVLMIMQWQKRRLRS